MCSLMQTGLPGMAATAWGMCRSTVGRDTCTLKIMKYMTNVLNSC